MSLLREVCHYYVTSADNSEDVVGTNVASHLGVFFAADDNGVVW